MDVFLQPTSIPPDAFIAAEVVINVVAGMFTVMRVSTNYRNGAKLWVDDSERFLPALIICIDCGISTIVGCAPALHAFWQSQVKKSALYSKAYARLSAILSNSLRHSKEHSPGVNDSHHIKVMTSHYIELDDSSGISGPANKVNAMVLVCGREA
ncbi:hypothetical protein AAE478_007361 [Parahypoxylon ruwenzoriense]